MESAKIRRNMKHCMPLDPDCPEVSEFRKSLYDDPMTAAMGAPVDDIEQGFASQHRAKCSRCQEHGLANLEVA